MALEALITVAGCYRDPFRPERDDRGRDDPEASATPPAPEPPSPHGGKLHYCDSHSSVVREGAALRPEANHLGREVNVPKTPAPTFRFDPTLLRAARQARGLLQDDVAERAEASRSLVALAELGYRRPAVETLARIADVVGVSLDDLFVPEDAP
jgi:DNA-binding XRE family transcriptional regulator